MRQITSIARLSEVSACALSDNTTVYLGGQRLTAYAYDQHLEMAITDDKSTISSIERFRSRTIDMIEIGTGSRHGYFPEADSNIALCDNIVLFLKVFLMYVIDIHS